LAAFRYFDRNNVGYLRVEDIEAIIHGLGMALSRGYVRDMLSEIFDYHSSKIYYANLAKRPVTSSSQTKPSESSVKTEQNSVQSNESITQQTGSKTTAQEQQTEVATSNTTPSS
jgi:hypothetical protein